ncbi:hypothetical protein BJ875DRAFT_374788 [Amylocarpus encephaloides]|uniref:Uncharacterized protein n=1 Tax=Amylocarpus encephaloides TaxID=45428 RepID=A0A9P7YLB1_9HELO|nr:hypothetical protein BJ875DRAFT_374788 [Amylocarpus encephaloides]
MVQLTCTQYPELQANPDISGIGVLSGFFAAAYIAFFCSISKIVIDGWRLTIRLGGNDCPLLDRWAQSLRSAVISFGDQQLATGFSILIAGYSQLSQGIAIYHWMSIVNLAWFSTVTHLFALTALRHDPDIPVHNSPILIFRVVSIGILIIMLMCAIYPVGYALGSYGVESKFPAWCFYHQGVEWADEGLKHSYSSAYLVFAYFALLYGFFSRCYLLLLSTHVAEALAAIAFFRGLKSPVRKLEDLISRSYGPQINNPAPITIINRLLHAFYALLVASINLYQSKLWEVTWLSATLVWGTLRILLLQQGFETFTSQLDIPTEVLEGQNIWGFGQVVPVVLLALPLLSFLGEWCWKCQVLAIK